MKSDQSCSAKSTKSYFIQSFNKGNSFYSITQLGTHETEKVAGIINNSVEYFTENRKSLIS